MFIMSCAELRAMAKELGIRGWSNAKKADLTAKIENHNRVKTLMDSGSGSTEAPTKVFEPQTQEALAEADAQPKAEPKAAKKRKKSSWDAWLAVQRKEKGLTLKQATQLPREDYAAFKESWKPEDEA